MATPKVAPIDSHKRPGGRRDTILTAATELFVRQGYQATGIDEIGAAADISGPAIYRHFSSKQDLLEASFDRLLETARTEWDSILGSGGSADARIRRFIDSAIRTTLDDRLVLTLFSREAQHLRPEKRRVIIRLYRQLVRDWACVMQERNPELSEAEASLAVGAVNNLIHAAALGDPGLPRPKVETILREMALSALKPILSRRRNGASA